MQMEPITLDHQQLLHSHWKPLCQNLKTPCSEFNFSNTFLFRRQHRYQLMKSDPPLVYGQFYHGGGYLIPTAPLPEFLPFAKKYLTETGACLFPIPEEWVPAAKSAGLNLSTEEDDSDYIYSAEKLKTLSGRHLSSRRNLMHQLEGNYSLESKPLTDERIPDAMHILEAWQQHSGRSVEDTDYFSAKDALIYRKELELFGQILYGDGTPLGWTLGVLLSPSTALLHSAKELPNIKGITPYLYHEFAQHLPQEISWINLEQDLGIPSLRQAKKAYHPDLLGEKWRGYI